MKIYVASSWRNPSQQTVVQALRGAGHDVYDFRNPEPGDTGFGWRQCASEAQLKDARAFRDEVLTHPVARAGFGKDMHALQARRRHRSGPAMRTQRASGARLRHWLWTTNNRAA